MNDFPSSAINRQDANGRHGDNVSLADSDDLESISGDGFVTYAPKEPFKLGYVDVCCLVINRMIGTGIFMSPKRVIQGTGSTGASLMFWLAGMIYCLCGTHVYIEYGLNAPRYVINGIEQSVPRSGGDLNYLQYVFTKPAYRKNTILLSTCIFGISFIILGNMAGNCINFAHRVLQAANVEDPNSGAVRGIAIAVATFTCFIHVVTRRGGIWLNNILAFVKIGIMLLIIIVALVVAGNGIPVSDEAKGKATGVSFEGQQTGANQFADAFLAIMFSFSGFEQPNYVLGEISRPRKKFPRAMTAGVSIVIFFYLTVNLAYMFIVPREMQLAVSDESVAEQFFKLTLGSLEGSSQDKSLRVFYALLAISSLGNIIVMTYTAARVKQEIAKEGILPYPKFFSQNTDISIGRLLYWFQRRGWFGSLLRLRWFSPEQHREKTPVGALVLHFCGCLILIFATYSLSPIEAYNFLTGWSAYVITAFFSFWLGLGIIILRVRGPPVTGEVDDNENDSSSALHHHADELGAKKSTWTELTGKSINPYVSFVTAVIYTLGGLYPVVTSFVRTTGGFSDNDIASKNGDGEAPARNGDGREAKIAWWLVPTMGWVVIGLGVAWFVGFLVVAKYTERNSQRVFVVEKRPEFDAADGSASASDVEGTGGRHSRGDPRRHGGLVLAHETVYLSWVGSETLRFRGQARGGGAGPGGEGCNGEGGGFGGEMGERDAASPFAGTDFEGHFMQQAKEQQRYQQYGQQRQNTMYSYGKNEYRGNWNEI